MKMGGKRTTSREKAANLERIRNNQRRCRARQKEHIASLEDKIRQYESANVDSTINQKLEQLATENESLKRLLQSLGLHSDFILAYRDATRLAPNVSQTRVCSTSALSPSRLQPHLKQSRDCDPRIPYVPSLPSPEVVNMEQEPQNLIQMDEPLPWEFSDFLTTSTCASEVSQTKVQAESFDRLTLESLMVQAFSHAATTDIISDTTSLCSWAFSLVLKNNSKGYSAADLDLKLRAGYRHGATPTEGCRIDNKILLNVLAEVL